MKSPFKFLDPYELQDRDAFFGRDAETKDLYSLITKNRLTFLYGPSGTGKTSLVKCGLGSCFDSIDWLRIEVRRGEDINESLRKGLRDALGGSTEFERDIPGAIRELYDEYRRPVYLIFDQFEELFILGKNDPEEKERRPFYDTVAAILDAELPCRLLFILREDYFAHLNQFEKIVPELYHRKLRVEPMNRDNLRQVITGSCKVHDIPFGDEQHDPDRILDNILAGKAGTHMPYVQVYLHMLYQEAGGNGSDKNARRKFREDTKIVFDESVIAGIGKIDDALERFLREQEGAILRNLKDKHPNVSDDTVRRVLDPFVSEEGTKVPVNYHTAPHDIKVLQGKAAGRLSLLDTALVSACLDELTESRILRRSETDYELAHDTLAAIITGQRSADLQQERDVYNRIEIGYKEHVESKGAYFLNHDQLIRNDPYLDKIELPPEWEAFLRASRADVKRRENAEQERVRRELRQQQRYTLIIGTVAFLAVIFAAWAFRQTQLANRERDAKDREKKNALEQEKMAIKNKQTAELRAIEADSLLNLKEALAADGARLKSTISSADTYNFLMHEGKIYLSNGSYRNALTYFATARFSKDTRDANNAIVSAKQGLAAEMAFFEGELKIAKSTYSSIIRAFPGSSLQAQQRLNEIDQINQAFADAIGERQINQVKVLSLKGKDLASLPVALGDLSSLEELDISLNRLQSLPRSTGILKKLKHLKITDCYLQSLPPDIGGLEALELLDLTNNQNLRLLPGSIIQLQGLHELLIGECAIVELPHSIGRLNALTKLNLEKNPIARIPPEISQLDKLRELNLRAMPSLDWEQALPLIFQIKSLEVLNLSGNQLSTLPPAVNNLKNLKTLDLRFNKFSDTAQEQIAVGLPPYCKVLF